MCGACRRILADSGSGREGPEPGSCARPASAGDGYFTRNEAPKAAQAAATRAKRAKSCRGSAQPTSFGRTTIVDIIRQIALTGSRRSEMITLKWTDADTEASCLRLDDRKEGESVRPIGLPGVEYLERRRTDDVGTYVFPGQGEDNAFGSFPSHWKHIFEDSPLSDVTPHVRRHSFASIANDLGFTEVTIAALVGHAKGSVTSKYIHTLDTALIMAADTISGYIQGLLDGIEFKQTAYALDRDSRKAALSGQAALLFALLVA
jgi:integrase